MTWMKNSNDKPDAILTMTFVAFVVILFKIVLSEASFSIGGFSMSFGNVDAGVVGAVMTPLVGGYVARRYTDKKYGAVAEFQGMDPDVDTSGPVEG